MQETKRLLKAIVFVVITFIFAFLLFTGRYPLLSPKDKTENIITDNSAGLNDKTNNNINKDIKPPLTNNSNKTENKEVSDIKNAINGAWQLIEINSQGKTAKIDLTKKVSPEETLIYDFSSDRINVYWGNKKSVLTYKWTKNNTIETVQLASSASEKDHKEWATMTVQGDKLYMAAVDTENNKSDGVFVRFKGELPKVISKSKQ